MIPRYYLFAFRGKRKKKKGIPTVLLVKPRDRQTGKDRAIRNDGEKIVKDLCPYEKTRGTLGGLQHGEATPGVDRDMKDQNPSKDQGRKPGLYRKLEKRSRKRRSLTHMKQDNKHIMPLGN